MSILVLTSIIASLFLVIGIAEPLAARLKLPFSVLLAALGVLIGAGASWFLRTPVTDVLNPVSEAILSLPIRSGVFLYVFLPILIFQATLGMHARRMLDDVVPILVLAVVAVLLATLSVGYALHWVSGLPLMVCLLVGAIISTTDPSAVVSIFRSISAPQRLARIVEGESLLNDAAAIALFSVFIGFVMRGVPDPDVIDAIVQFPWLLLGGGAVGWIMARMAVTLMGWLAPYDNAQISVSIALPPLAFIAAGQLVNASGVVAVVAAGLTLNLMGPKRLAPTAWANLREVWDLLAHYSGAFIFVLAALLIPRLLGELRLSDLGLMAVVAVAAIGSRMGVLFGLLPALTALRASPAIEVRYRLAILWGGLRGAVTLALALAVTENALVTPEVRRLVGILATGFTLFTLIVQGTTLRLVIRRLGLDRLSPLDAALAKQVIATALQSVRSDVAEITQSYGLSHDVVRSEAKVFAKRVDIAVAAAEDGATLQDRDRITLGLVALAGAERDMIMERFRNRDISQEVAETALAEADRLIEMTRSGGRTGYRRAGRAFLGNGRAMSLAIRLYSRARISGLLSRLVSERFEILLMQRLTLKDLHAFIDGRIRRIHGRRVADLLHDLLNRRAEEVEQAIEGLRLQFPGYAEELERRLIRRKTIRFEQREYDALMEEGLVGEELHAQLSAEVQSRRTALEGRTPLDLAVQKQELVRQLPMLAALDETTRRRLSRALKTQFVAPGDIVIRRNEAPRSVYFIASGAVELNTAGQKLRMGRGEMFGQFSVLARRPRRTEVRAITHGVLLALDEAAFRKLMERSPALRASVRRSAEERGLTAETMDGLGLSEPRSASGGQGRTGEPSVAPGA
jgi:CPA1 family monovalent cation:H+ antiporter